MVNASNQLFPNSEIKKETNKGIWSIKIQQLSLWNVDYYLKWISEWGRGWQTLFVSRSTRLKNWCRMHKPRSISPNKNWGSHFYKQKSTSLSGFSLSLSLSPVWFLSLSAICQDFIISAADIGQEPTVKMVRPFTSSKLLESDLCFKDSEISYLRLILHTHIQKYIFIL